MAGNAVTKFYSTQQPVNTQLAITTSSLPQATVGTAYNAPLSSTGGVAPISWNIDSCTPNDGLWLQCVGPDLKGTPQMAETETVTIRATDSVGNTVTATFPLLVVASGSLSIVSSASAGTAPAGGSFAYQMLAAGGQPPYSWTCGNQAQPFYVTWNGWLIGTPTVSGTVSFDVMVADNNGGTATQTVSVTVNTTLAMGGVDSTTGRIYLPPARAGQPYQAQLYAAGGTNAGYDFTGTQLPAWATLAPSGVITGTPTAAGNTTSQFTVTDSGNNQAAAVGLFTVLPSGKVARPAYNSSPANGFFVLNGQLYDPVGFPFRIRGLDRTHYDSNSWSAGNCGARTGANAVRVFMFDGETAAFAVTQCQQQYLSATAGGSSGNFILPILTLSGIGATGTSGVTTTPILYESASDWFSYYSTLSELGGNFIINPANEWGPTNSNVWQNAYQYIAVPIATMVTVLPTTTITLNSNAPSNPFASCPFGLLATPTITAVVTFANPGGSPGAWTIQTSSGNNGSGGTLYGGMVGVLRGSGYTNPILIDSGGSGQDPLDILNYAQAIQQADPLQNCLFALHAYNCVANGQGVISAITKANPAVITLSSSLPYHPLTGIAANAPTWPIPGSSANNFVLTYSIAGVEGMTQINGLVNCSNGNPGGTQGSWTVTLSGVNSTGYGTYTGGGTIVPASNGGAFNPVVHYGYMAQQLSALQANNVCVGFFEFGPGNAWGARSIAFTGSCSGTTLTVTAMLTAGNILTNAIGANGYGGMLLTDSSGSLGVTVSSQLTQTGGDNPGLRGTYQLSGTASVSSQTLWFQNPSGNWGTMLDSDPTSVYLGQIICAAEAYQMPWCYWAFDDHNIGTNQETSWIGWFGMANANTAFTVPSDLTPAGIDITYNPRYGVRALASPAVSMLSNVVTSITLTPSITTATGAWTFGQPFKQGDVPPSDSIIALGGNTQLQADIRNRWSDGSVKYAVLSGISNFTANTPLTIQLATGTAASGTNVAEPTSLPNTFVTFTTTGGTFSIAAGGTYAINSVLGVAQGSWTTTTGGRVRSIPGPVMSEFHYFQPTSDAGVSIWWYVRAYSSGAIEVEAVIENGWILKAGPTQRDYGVSLYINSPSVPVYSTTYIGWGLSGEPQYTPSYSVGGGGTTITANSASYASNGGTLVAGVQFYVNGSTSTIYTVASYAGQTITLQAGQTVTGPINSVTIIGHPTATRWSYVGWINGAPTVPQHNSGYFLSTKLVPNYGYWNPSTNAQVFITPDSNAWVGPGGTAITSTVNPPPYWPGDPDVVMSNVGYHESIGILPRVQALYAGSGASQAYTASIGNCRAVGHWPIFFRDDATGRAANYLSHASLEFPYANWTQAIGITTPLGAHMELWDSAHHPSEGYLPYLVEGRWTQLEVMQFTASYMILVGVPANRTLGGGHGNLASIIPTTRGFGWSFRSVSQAAALSPRTLMGSAANVPTLDATLATAYTQSIQDTANYAASTFIPASLGGTATGVWANTSGYIFQADNYGGSAGAASVVTVSGSTTVTMASGNVPASYFVGAYVDGPTPTTGLPSGAQITSIGTNTFTVDAAHAALTSGTYTVAGSSRGSVSTFTGALWMVNYQTVAFSLAVDLAIEGLTTPATLATARNFLYNNVVPFMNTGASTSVFPFQNAANYAFPFLTDVIASNGNYWNLTSVPVSNIPSPHFMTPLQQWQYLQGQGQGQAIGVAGVFLPNYTATSGGALYGPASESPIGADANSIGGFGYWAMFSGALAYAVDAGQATLGQWNLITNASNYNPTLAGSGGGGPSGVFNSNDTPQFSFVPRT